MLRCAFWKYHLHRSVESGISVGKHAAETTWETRAERGARHTESPTSQGAVGMGEVDRVTAGGGVVGTRLDLHTEGAGVPETLQACGVGLLEVTFWGMN